MKLSETAEIVLERRYYLKDEDGKVIENWKALCTRVARAVSSVEASADSALDYGEQFFSMIYSLDFLPNSPCLMNAGTEIGQLSACFVLPVEDSMDGIFTSIKNGALIHKSGGGTGYSFNRLRGKNAPVKSTQGIASGPLSFMEVFDTATNTIKQGGKRRGANMAVLGVDHPDIMDFIDAKEDPTKFTNFNFSVAIYDRFMKAVIDGRDEEVMIFNRIVERAHRTGEPGVLFIDRANKDNPTPHLGDFEATNPCGEQWLLPYESCNLGSINLSNFVIKSPHTDPSLEGYPCVDWDRLKEVVVLAVRFLDNVIDCNVFPIPEIEEMTKKTRKIGLGIMGLHDMLIQLEVPYASANGLAIANDVMGFINNTAIQYSEELASEKGYFPAYHPDCDFHPRRNAVLTSIQPTGTVSMIADCASGCEPYFSTVMVKHVMDGDKLLMVNKHFERVAKERGFYSEELMQAIAEKGSLKGIKGIPPNYKEVFATAQDISPRDHINMQAVLQKHVGASISKTINLPADATKEDVAEAYKLAWTLGCKGLTVYRDGCRAGQPLNAGTKEEKTEEPLLSPGVSKINLPEILSAKRYRLKGIDGDTIYLIVCFDESERPMEVFVKFPFDNRIDSKDKSTMWTTTCRLVSLALRCAIPMDEIIKQLDRSSGHMLDLPAQLGKLLKSFMAGTQKGFTSPCPDCEGVLVFEEGCECCKSCGYSKCS